MYREWKKLTRAPICQGNLVQCLIPFSYVKWQIGNFHCIPSCSLNLCQMSSKTYHSVAGNVTYKDIPSLLLPHPPHRSYPSNRFPLLTTLFLSLIGTRSQRFEIFDFFKKTSIQFRKGKYLTGPKVDFNHFGCKDVLTTSSKRGKKNLTHSWAKYFFFATVGPRFFFPFKKS